MSVPEDIKKSRKNFAEKQDRSSFSLENHPPSGASNCSDPLTDTTHTSKTLAAFQLPSQSSAMQLVSTGSELVNLDNQRIADLCCGVCCDLVRACIIVNCCDIGMSLLQILLPALGYTDFLIDTINFDAFEKAFDDDEAMQSVQEERKINTFVTVMTICGLVFSIIGIVGAMKFRRYLVLTTAIWYCIDVVRCAITLQWINIAVNGCFAYPHIALFTALRGGKISRERYHIEKHCCCV